MAVILIVDDETLQRDILTAILSDEGYETLSAASGEEALRLVKAYEPDLVLTDLKMGRMDGIELLEKIKGLKQPPTVILMTAFGTVDSAVEAMKKGAFDYLTKPLDKEVVLLAIRRALERRELMQHNLELRKALNDMFSIQGIIGHSKAIKDVIHIVRKVADSPATVLILGESGTGKELIAKAIHYNSARREKAFMAVNCAAIPETLLESELFGYEPGAFTGATQRRKGLFEAAGGGTIFLDEVGDLPLMTQSKILRVLQEREIMRVGGREPIKVDVRVVSATNKDLHEEMRNGRFREDLFYRLKVVTIHMPPLRERKEDIPDLANFFLQKFNHSFGKNVERIDDAAMKGIVGYSWPGNVRELQSVLEKAVLMSESDTIGLGDIRGELRSDPRAAMGIEIPDEGIDLEELEKELLVKAMAKSNNVIAKAARLLDMNYDAFWYSWKKHELDSPEMRSALKCIMPGDLPDVGISYEELEKDLMQKAMEKANHVGARAAKLLNMSYRAFAYRWDKYGLSRPPQG
ncbi:MAG TPA: sigma 54-interacting transcriptional regulator [Syntrophales bacterium]|nr:sigma 54-interacting transcriptional regulator [Syntrophales bacterium]